MKYSSTKLFMVTAGLLAGAVSFADPQGILPGEPDPNLSPGKDKVRDETLIDDRAKCPKGMKRYQKMRCGSSKDTPQCDNYSPVLECRRKPLRLKCKKPHVPIPVYRCEP